MSTAAPPRRRRTLQVAIGVVLVVLAFVGVLVFSKLSAGGGATAVTIVGANREIKTASAVTSDDLTTISLDVLPTGAVRDKSFLVGKIARHDISKGTPVLDTDLASPAIGTAAKLYFALPSGKVALNIPASDISPYVQPGDQIDIIASPKTATSGNSQAAASPQYKVTLKGLRVLSVGAPQSAAASGAAAGGNLIVEVNLQDAEAIEFLIKNTDFTYVLRSPLDQASPDPATTGVDLPTFKSIYGFHY